MSRTSCRAQCFIADVDRKTWSASNCCWNWAPIASPHTLEGYFAKVSRDHVAMKTFYGSWNTAEWLTRLKELSRF